MSTNVFFENYVTDLYNHEIDLEMMINDRKYLLSFMYLPGVKL